MKRFVVAGLFGVAGLLLPGYVASAQQEVPPPAGTGQTTVRGGQAGQAGTIGTSGRTDSAPHGKVPKSAKSGTSDETFVRNAAEGGLAEVELGKLATQNAASDDVKKFGQRMVDDHTKANDQLKDIASKENLKLPSDLNAKDKATKNRLEKLKGAAFDRAYMADMVKDHTKDVAEFKKEAGSGADADLKGFATSTLPTLESHLSDAKTIDSAVKTSGASTKKSSKTSKDSK